MTIEPPMAKLNRKMDEVLQMDGLTEDQKAGRISTICCIACATKAIQPIPVAGIHTLTPIQTAAAVKIAHMRGVEITKEEAERMLAEMGAMGIAAQHTALGVWKVITGRATGWMITFPMAYAITYGIMKAVDAYYISLTKGKPLYHDEISKIMRKAKREGKKEAKKHIKGRRPAPERDKETKGEGA